MRRSRAPSIRKNEVIPEKIHSGDSDANNGTIIKRSTSSIINLIEAAEVQHSNSESIASIAKDPTSNSPRKILTPINHDSGNSSKIFMSVVWGKRSTKKHKTWEGDGTLEILHSKATVTSAEGKYLGSTTIKSEEDIEIGNRLIVGTNEIEIIERLKGFPHPVIVSKRIMQDDQNKNDEKQYKKPKAANPSCFTPNLVLSNSKSMISAKRFSHSSVSNNNSGFTIPLPKPPSEHQWIFNKSSQPIKQVSVISDLAQKLRPHQREGVLFLYECLLGFRDHDKFGCILADEMGLGKTLQCIAVCYTLLKQGPYGKNVANKVLIVTPSSLVENWNKEIHKWLSQQRIFTFQIDAKHKLEQFTAANHIPFLLISYEMFVKQFEKLNNITFDIIICDEGHRLKNNSIKVAMLLNQLNCKRRIILTGTPIQNDLQEFYSLNNFVNPGILGTYAEYKQKFELPIVASQQPDVFQSVKELGERRAIELNTITGPFVLRRTQDVINKYLPKKREFIVFCKPSELQQILLKSALEYYENQKETYITVSALQIITILKKICNHPSLIRTTKKEDPLIMQLKNLLPSWQQIGPHDSGKLSIVQNMLEELIKLKEKIVLISHHTKTLDMLQNLLDHFNYKYCRLDGKTQASTRSGIVDRFNNPINDIFVFLLSAKAGGVGLNLIGASRLVLFDNDWNPAADLQALSRIWRDGQKREVYVYRLVTAGTIEEKIFQRQLSKTSLSDCVVDQREKIDKLKLSDKELKDLFSVQDSFDICGTHELLDCACIGNGENLLLKHEEPIHQSEFYIDLSNDHTTKSLKIHELTSWEHYKAPIKQQLLQEMCIPDKSAEIVFIFQNQNDT